LWRGGRGGGPPGREIPRRGPRREEERTYLGNYKIKIHNNNEKIIV